MELGFYPNICKFEHSYLYYELYNVLFFHYLGSYEAAMITSIHLKEFDDILDPVDIYSLLGNWLIS